MTKKCFECNSTGNLHEHHVVPRSKGGTKTLTLCEICHSKVHGRNLENTNLIRNALNEKKKKGEVMGNWCPFGFKEKNGKYVKKIFEYNLMKKIILINERKEKTQEQIADELNKNKIKPSKGEKWNRTMVCKNIKKFKEMQERLNLL